MRDESGHPDDATLFDLLEGALDPAREQAVAAHLERCAACAAFMDAARAGAPETTTAVVSMPEAAAQRMHLRLAEGWRARVSALAAAEARADAAAPTTVPLPSMPPISGPPPTPPAPRPRERGGWRRLLVPGLAFAVLATLAGTSIWVGQDASAPSSSAGGARTDAATELAPSQDATTGATDPLADTAAPATAVPATAAPVTAESDAAAAAAGGSGAAAPEGAAGAAADVDGRTVPIAPGTDARDEGIVIEPPVGYDELVPGQLCAFAFDPSALVLPDGRIPQQVIGPGPLGSYLACG